MKYFTIDELCRSATASRRGIPNIPDICARDALTTLVDRVLDPLRAAYGKPVVVTSGFRSAAVNKAVGGAKGSHHQRGMAADIVGTPNTPEENRRLFDLVRQLKLPFTQLIHEKGTLAAGPQWVHVSLDVSDVRRQVLYTLDGRTYRPWPKG